MNILFLLDVMVGFKYPCSFTLERDSEAASRNPGIKRGG